jgi:hypothetical protein
MQGQLIFTASSGEWVDPGSSERALSPVSEQGHGESHCFPPVSAQSGFFKTDKIGPVQF